MKAWYKVKCKVYEGMTERLQNTDQLKKKIQSLEKIR